MRRDEDVTELPISRPRLFDNASFSPEHLESDLRLPASHSQYATFFTPRSGSTWLAEVLHSNGIGNPREWLNPQVVRSTVARVNASDPASYWQMLDRKEAPHGVFGLKVTYFHLVRTLIDPAHFFRRFSTDAPVFFLFREDIVSQAISLAKAFDSGIFHSPQATKNQLSEVDATFNYNPATIRVWVTHLLAMEKRTTAFLRAFAIRPRTLTYEVVTQLEPDRIARYFASFLPRCEITGETAPAALQRKIATSKNTEFLERFTSENSAFLEEVERARSAQLDDARRSQERELSRF